MIKTIKYCVSVSVVVMALSAGYAQAQQPTKETSAPVTNDTRIRPIGQAFNFSWRSRSANDGFRAFNSKLTPLSGGAAVKGSGTAGMVPIWLDSGTLSDSIITQSGAKIGIGTSSPGSTLSVVGMIETTMGGYKFPDGTIQSTAATGGLTVVVHDSTLKGAGTSGSPLGVNIPLVLDGTSGTFPVLRVRGKSDDFPGVLYVTDETPLGPDASGVAINGISQNWIGVLGRGPNIGVLGEALGDGSIGVRGFCVGTNCKAGDFQGNVNVTGTLTKGGGSFKIDHPLDPENKYLYHSFVESPDMMNIYNGNATLDSNGEAVVELPDWYGALNRDARYLLTAIGAPGPSLYIAQKIANNRFKIAGGQPGMEVSWQVTGIRRDAWANKHRIPVEEQKSDTERGYYLHPELFNQPEEKSVEWARNPQAMQRMKQEREEVKPQKQQKK
jgi:hypothetical protein